MALLRVMFLILMAVASGSASAQTCAAPIPIYHFFRYTDDTCTAQNELGTLCIFAQSPANDIIYTISLAPPFDDDFVVLVNKTAAWNAALVLIQACDGDSTCPRVADAGGAGADELLDVRGLTTGTYFVVVTSAASDTSCGSYSLSVSFFIPVELQSFDID